MYCTLMRNQVHVAVWVCVCVRVRVHSFTVSKYFDAQLFIITCNLWPHRLSVAHAIHNSNKSNNADNYNNNNANNNSDVAMHICMNIFKNNECIVLTLIKSSQSIRLVSRHVRLTDNGKYLYVFLCICCYIYAYTYWEADCWL